MGDEPNVEGTKFTGIPLPAGSIRAVYYVTRTGEEPSLFFQPVLALAVLPSGTEILGNPFLNWSIRAIEIQDRKYLGFVNDPSAESPQSNFLGYDDGTMSEEDWLFLANQEHEKVNK